MPKRNFGFEKRQKELEKQRKRAQKLLRRSERAAEGDVTPDGGPAEDGDIGPAAPTDEPPVA